jgi:hypothetical protein
MMPEGFFPFGIVVSGPQGAALTLHSDVRENECHEAE